MVTSSHEPALWKMARYAGFQKKLTDFKSFDCYQCGKSFDGLKKLAVHQYYEPAHYVTPLMAEILPEEIV